MNTRRALAVFCAAVLLAPTTSEAASVAQFMDDVISALSLAEQARSRAVDVNADDPISTESGLRFAINDLRKAKEYVESYQQDQDEMVRTSANGLVEAFDLLIRFYGENGHLMDRLYKMQVEGASVDELLKLKNEGAQQGVDIDNAWEMVMLSAIAASHVLVGSTTGERMDRLVLTAEEQQALIRQIDAVVPEAKTGLRTGQTKVVAGIAGIRQVLAEFPPKQ